MDQRLAITQHRIALASGRVRAAVRALVVALGPVVAAVPMSAPAAQTAPAAAPPAKRAAGHAAAPYAGEQSREIKSLSMQEMQALLAGRGMGFAKAAELNGYPGPAHVLELDVALALDATQRRRTQTLFEAMEQDAILLGKALVEAERRLDHLFASGAITPQSLASVLAETGDLQARLRGVHLQAHIEQARILTHEQVARYAQLRGYGDQSGSGGHGDQRGHGEHRP